MVLQFYKSERWHTYKGAKKEPIARKRYKRWRLLSRDRSKILATGNYNQVLKRERQIVWYKHYGSSLFPRRRKVKIYKKYRRGVKHGGQTYWVNLYNQILKETRKKGYRLPRKRDLKISEIDIPEKFAVDGFTMPIEEGYKKWSKKKAKKFRDKFLVGIDDDAPKENKRRAVAHEIGHITLYFTKKKPHTEFKAEKIGADILDMPLEKFRENIVFDKNWKKKGIQLPKRRRKR